MSRFIVAFGHCASREKIGQLIEQCGHALCGSFRSGAEVLRCVQQQGGGIVVCGYKLSDMTADELALNLENKAQVLVVASPLNLELVESASVSRISSPISRALFREKLEELVQLDQRGQARGAQRTPEERALIDHAKALLIARGMTEAQAHSALQQRSMRNRCKLTETAQQIIVAYEINARI